jgi:protein dithiol:quinone oxidoreductase
LSIMSNDHRSVLHSLTSWRVGNLAASLVCAAMMGFALFSQYVWLMEPCPLCVFQRMALIALGSVFLLAGLHAAGLIGRLLYALLVVAAAGAGVGVAGRHVWLQNLPKDQVPACGPGLDFMVDTFPLFEVLNMVLSGSGECAEVSWRFLGLTMPAWSLISFVVLGGWGAWLNWTNRR